MSMSGRGSRVSLVHVLVAWSLMSFGPSASSDPGTVDELKERIIRIQNERDLRIADLTLCRKIDGYGKYVPYDKNVVKRDAVVHFYYEPKNVFTNVSKSGYTVTFSQDVVLENSGGDRLLEMPKALNFDYTSNKPILDLYAQFELNLEGAQPGKYLYKIVVYDELKGTKAEAELPFRIK